MMLSLDDLPCGGEALSSGLVEVSRRGVGSLTVGGTLEAVSFGGSVSGDGGGTDSSLRVECIARLPRLEVSERRSSDEPSLLMRSGLLSREDFLL